jgi:multidrug efflux pump subunit AcrA (membrane-fusion protein)
MNKPVKWTLFVLCVALLLGAGFGLLYLGTRHAGDLAPPEEHAVPVTAVRLGPRDFAAAAEYTARLSAASDITVTARVGGTIEEDLITEGEEVRKDQPLYRVEDDSYRYAMDQAEAALDLARQNHLKTQNISRPELIHRLEALLVQRESSLKKAENDAARYEELHREGAIPLSRKEESDLALTAARAQLEIARKNLEEARTGARAEDQAAAEAAVRQAEAAWKLARNTWEKTVIRSPLQGTIAAKKVFAGDTVQPGMPVAEVVDLTSFKIEFGVSDADVAFFKAGKKVTVSPRHGGEPLPAVVRDVGVKADEKTGSFPVILRMGNPGGGTGGRILRAGMDVTVLFTRIELHDVLVLPSSALLREVGRSLAFVVEDGVARRREVTLGPEYRGDSVVTGGLKEGEVLVVVGQQQLRDGDKVELTLEQ